MYIEPTKYGTENHKASRNTQTASAYLEVENGGAGVAAAGLGVVERRENLLEEDADDGQHGNPT